MAGSLMNLGLAKHLGLNNQLFSQLADLPGTAGMESLKQRAEALSGWRVSAVQQTVFTAPYAAPEY